MGATPNWEFLDRFRWTPPPATSISWAAAERLIQSARAPLERGLDRLGDLLERSDSALHDLVPCDDSDPPDLDSTFDRLLAAFDVCVEASAPSKRE